MVSHPNRTPEVVRGCRIRNGAVSCCVSMLCSVMTACHRLRGGIMGAFPACRRHPGRRNTGLRPAATPRGVAKMLAFGHRLRVGRGVRCSHRWADAALRPDWRRRDGGDRANGANRLRCVSSAWGAGRLRCVSSVGSTPKWVQLIITRYNGSCAGNGTSPPGCVPKVRSCSEGVASSEGRTFGTHFVGVSTHPGTTALYRVMIGHATLWLLLCGSAAHLIFFHFVITV